jgi:hypothetical protein
MRSVARSSGGFQVLVIKERQVMRAQIVGQLLIAQRDLAF